MIILSPVGPYFESGLAPTKMYVEDVYVRAVKGGTGEAQMRRQLRRQPEGTGNRPRKGLRTDPLVRRNRKEIHWGDRRCQRFSLSSATEVVTSELNGSILPGITRNSIIALCKKKGIKVSERKISIDELEEAYRAGQLKEMFASGTAAIVSPVGELLYKGERMIINDNQIGPVAQEMYDTIYGIQTGKIEDFMDWTVAVE